MTGRIREWLERMRWRPPEPEQRAKDQRAENAHQAAIRARQAHERSLGRLEPRVARVERLAAATERASRHIRL